MGLETVLKEDNVRIGCLTEMAYRPYSLEYWCTSDPLLG